MFMDQATVFIKAGDGGNGCVAFQREKFRPRGGPSGGDGGHGGSVIFRTAKNLRTLIDFHHKHHFRAQPGSHGQGDKRAGKKGEDLIIAVPCGTVIKEVLPGGEKTIADLTEDGALFVAAQGGRGGRGNARFANSVRQAPRFATPGGEGPERHLQLELKLIADVGFIGYPNSGKSSLLAKISAARPKIADYPFTTLEPHLGLVRLDEVRSFVAADIPGLIEGAADGKGLGHTFLRHVERARILVHLIDLTEPDVQARYAAIRKELTAHSPALAEKTEIIVGNKTDLPASRSAARKIKKLFPEAHNISAVTGKGVKELLEEMWKRLS